jgi:hypothetical protein
MGVALSNPQKLEVPTAAERASTESQSAKRTIEVRVLEQPTHLPAPSVLGPIIVGVLIALVPACVGYGVSFLNDLRKGNLDFTNKQIEKLYGPLYALTQANDATWKQFTKTVMQNEGKPVYFTFERPISADQTTAWRSWMKTVFQPMNEKIEKIIEQNAQLIAGDQMPSTFQALVAHAEAYKGLIATWKDEDKSQPDYGSLVKNTVGLNYPDGIVACVEQTYLALKKHQQELQYSYIVYPWRANKVDSAEECKQKP